MEIFFSWYIFWQELVKNRDLLSNHPPNFEELKVKLLKGISLAAKMMEEIQLKKFMIMEKYRAPIRRRRKRRRLVPIKISFY